MVVVYRPMSIVHKQLFLNLVLYASEPNHVGNTAQLRNYLYRSIENMLGFEN